MVRRGWPLLSAVLRGGPLWLHAERLEESLDSKGRELGYDGGPRVRLNFRVMVPRGILGYLQVFDVDRLVCRSLGDSLDLWLLSQGPETAPLIEGVEAGIQLADLVLDLVAKAFQVQACEQILVGSLHLDEWTMVLVPKLIAAPKEGRRHAIVRSHNNMIIINLYKIQYKVNKRI